MDEPRDCHTEWSMKNREDTGAETLYDIHYKQNLKRHDTNELTYQMEKVSQT